MADIESAFTTYLLARAGLTALIGARIYPDIADQGAQPPYVVWLLISDVKLHTLTGQSTQERPNYQFTVYANTKPSAKAIGAQIKLALNDYQGTMNGVVVQKIELINELSNFEKNADGTSRTYTLDLEYEITFENT